MDLTGKDVTLAALAMSQRALSKRQELIGQNIANVNTPDYKRQDITFAEELAGALDSGGPRQERADRVFNVLAKEVVEERLFYRPDMGGVDLDREMAELAKTSMQGAAVTQLIQRKLHQYRMVIKEGRV